MKKKGLDLIKLTLAEDGNLFARIYKPFGEDLSEAQLESILDHIKGIVKVIGEVDNSIGELEEEDENE